MKARIICMNFHVIITLLFFQSIKGMDENIKVLAYYEESTLSEDSDYDPEIERFSVVEMEKALREKLSSSREKELDESMRTFNECMEEELQSCSSTSTTSLSHSNSQRTIPLVSRSSSLSDVFLYQRKRFEFNSDDDPDIEHAKRSLTSYSYSSLQENEPRDLSNDYAYSVLNEENPDADSLDSVFDQQFSLYLRTRLEEMMITQIKDGEK